jgi:excisionase family DNA binding protein
MKKKSSEVMTMISAKEMAAVLGVSAGVLYELARAKKIPHLRIGDRVVFNKERVIAALENEPEDSQPSGCRPKVRRQAAVNQ